MNILIILGLILIVYMIYTSFFVYSETRYKKSNVDNQVYMIRRGNNKTEEFLQESADTLGEINLRMLKLITYLDQTYKDDIYKYYFIKKLKENYSPKMISEAAIDPRYTTYTIDKKEMHLCLRTRDSKEKTYDINLLIFVQIHEMSHLCNYTRSGEPIQGHGSEFRMIFKFLVEEAIKIGIYNYEDYSKNPKEFCGMTLKNNII